MRAEFDTVMRLVESLEKLRDSYRASVAEYAEQSRRLTRDADDLEKEIHNLRNKAQKILLRDTLETHYDGKK